MSRYIAGRVDEIPPGGRKIVEVDGRSIGVFNIGGEFFALLNHCPHAGAPLCRGLAAGIAEAELPGIAIRYERRGEFIRCPWHQWEFDIKTGQSWFDPRRLRARRYEVDVAHGTPEECIDPAAGDRQPGPHVAEGYDASVEGDYIVIDTARRRAGTATSTPSQA